MARPVIGIIGNAHLINDEYPVQAVGVSNIEAVADLTGAIPLVVPALPKVGAIADLIEACDGFVFTGGRPNVHPSHYGHEPTEKHGAFDPDRDAVTLPLIRECVARSVPVFGICRGFQEFNVAFGGTLTPNPRDPRPDEPPHAARRHARGEVRAPPHRQPLARGPSTASSARARCW